jgi:hypothetical protein
LNRLYEHEWLLSWQIAASTKKYKNYSMTQNTDSKELESIFNDPNYDQSKLQDWFQTQFGENWRLAWQRYLETGRIN